MMVSPARGRIIEFLMEPYKAEQPGSAITEIAEMMMIQRDTVAKQMRKLINAGVLGAKTVRTGNSPNALDEVWLIEDIEESQ